MINWLEFFKIFWTNVLWSVENFRLQLKYRSQEHCWLNNLTCITRICKDELLKCKINEFVEHIVFIWFDNDNFCAVSIIYNHNISAM